MKKLRYIALATVLLGLAVIVIITRRIGLDRIINMIAGASIVFVACYLITSLLIAMVLSFKWKLILHSKGIDIPYHKLFAYRLVGYSVSYLTPTAHVGGEPIRAYLLKREGVKTTTAFSTVIIDKSIEIMADVVFFFLGAVLIINSVAVEGSTKIVLLTFSLILILLLGMFVGGILSKSSMFVSIFRFLRLGRLKHLRNIERSLAQVEKEIEQFYRTKKQYFLAIVVLILFLWALMFLEYRFALLIFGKIATPMQIFLILTGVGLAYSLPIPAAMGTLELGQLSAAKVLNLSPATGITLAFLVRTRDLIWTVIGLVFLSVYQFNFKNLTQQTSEIDKKFQRGKFMEKGT